MILLSKQPKYSPESGSCRWYSTTCRILKLQITSRLCSKSSSKSNLDSCNSCSATIALSTYQPRYLVNRDNSGAFSSHEHQLLWRWSNWPRDSYLSLKSSVVLERRKMERFRASHIRKLNSVPVKTMTSSCRHDNGLNTNIAKKGRDCKKRT